MKLMFGEKNSYYLLVEPGDGQEEDKIAVNRTAVGESGVSGCRSVL